MSKITKLIAAQQTYPLEASRFTPKFNYAKVAEHYTKDYATMGV